MAGLAAALFLLVFTHLGEARGKIGIVAVEAQYSNAEQFKEIAEALGHDSEFVTEEMLAGDGGELNAYDLIILTYRHSNLLEREYEVLAGYVRDGGNLFLIGIAAYWMYLDPDDRMGEHRSPRRGIRGGGPVEEVTGAVISTSPSWRGAAEKFRVVEKNPYTAGLADEFEFETRPPYSVENEIASGRIRRTQVKNLKAVTADVLIEADVYYEEADPDTGERKYNLEETATSAFLLVNSYGEGKCVWLACRAEHFIQERTERNVLRIVSNVLENSVR